ncbi:MAG TPA: hypothetical protein VN520_13630 [Streptomyces sp.]|uniref:hypothetical protein n=1 Tax=Streptomyces sp. TaxID=1931 RepID=UPI002BAC59A9|nr:hypothetical protein [Streptomyces sp.]HWU07395.1 hypothetical protein [Streptomyces sp.]
MAERRVLLLTRSGDGEFTRVAGLLRRIGVPVHRLDADRLEGIGVSWGSEGLTPAGGRPFTPTVVWRRHFSTRAAPAPPAVADGMLYRDSWDALADGLLAGAGEAVGGTDPGQPRQLAQAAAAGVRVPRTLLTTDPSEAAAHLPPGRHVVKVADRHYVEPVPGRLTWYLPRVVEDHDPPGAPGVPRGTPVLVQEYVEHEAELRVYLAGDEIVAFDVAKADPRDIWDRPDRVRVRRVAPPPSVTAAVRTLARGWHLRYGAFDFLLAGGEAVFLEMNAHGDWLWYERRAGSDAVTQAAVRMVRDLHRSLTGAPARPVDLLAFLGAGATGDGRQG